MNKFDFLKLIYEHENARESLDSANQKKLCEIINENYRKFEFKRIADDSEIYEDILKNDSIITVSFNPETEADLVITDEDIAVQRELKHNLDLAYYTRLYIEGKLEKCKRSNFECVVCGMSCTQYGIREKDMIVPTLNLSVTGQDVAYCIDLAKKTIDNCKSINHVIVTMSYYQGFYDISSSGQDLHRDMMEKVNIPILENRRNYSKYKTSDKYLQFIEEVCDLDESMQERNDTYRSLLGEREFFNEFFPEPIYGGLAFDFLSRSYNEKRTYGLMTARDALNICSEIGEKESMAAVVDFLDNKSDNLHVIFFSPPITQYVYEGIKGSLRDRFMQTYMPVFERYTNVDYYDWSNCSEFVDNDFRDFKHLSASGRVKLNHLLNEAIVRRL